MKLTESMQALAYAGVGSGLGAVLAAVISSRSGRSQVRAQAADLLTEAAERVSHMNQSLDKENRMLRYDISQIIRAVDDFANKKIDLAELQAICDKARFD